jgi:transposase-like protein
VEESRREMVRLVRRGQSMRQVAREFGVSLSHVQRWVKRAGNGRLERGDFSDRKAGPKVTANRTDARLEELVLEIRRQLKEKSALGEFGAVAIHRELVRRRIRPKSLPTVRTIGRILERRGALDGRRRVRRNPPPPGWYLPQRDAELDSFDIIEGLRLEGGAQVEVLNVVSLHGGLPGSWPRSRIVAKTVISAMLSHWRRFGLPVYAQFDNDNVFQGAHHVRDVIGRVSRVCLSLGVTPVFVPPRETGFQAAIENLNGRWQSKNWARFHFGRSRTALLSQSSKFVRALRRRCGQRIASAPPRIPFPKDWQQNLQVIPPEQIIYLRRTNDRGQVEMLGRKFDVAPSWPHRLVRAEVDLEHDCIRFYALRRRDPDYQPLLKTVSHHIQKNKPFRVTRDC